MLLWGIIQTMKALNIPISTPGSVRKLINGTKQSWIKKNKSVVKWRRWCTRRVAGACAVSVSPPMTRSFLMINANSNDSSPVSCVCSDVVPSGVARVTRGAPAPLRWTRTTPHGLNTQSRPHQQFTKMNPHTETWSKNTPGVSCEVSKSPINQRSIY